jgi:CRISPR-associated protein Csd2
MATATVLDFNKLAQNRLDIVFLFDVTDGNPNGDPDAGNAPRTDSETGQGLITDVALKRKVRDYVAAARSGQPRYNIYIKLHSALHEQREPAYKAIKVTQEEFDALKGKAKNEKVVAARKWMCENYFDVRAFGAVMSVDDFNAGQVRGPLQFTFGRSVDRIADMEQAITLKAVQAKKKAEQQRDDHGVIVGDMGRKSIVPYALFRSHIFFNPHFAKDTGFTGDDLQVALDAFQGMFEIDRSAARGQMSACRIYAFAHDSALGNAQAARLFESVEVLPSDERASGGTREESPPRKFKDYKITFEGGAEPEIGAERQMKGFPKVRVIRFL